LRKKSFLKRLLLLENELRKKQSAGRQRLTDLMLKSKMQMHFKTRYLTEKAVLKSLD